MLLFTSPDGSSLHLAVGSQKLVFFPEKPVSGAVSFFSKPDEHPQDGTVSWPGEYDFSGISIRGIGQNEGGHVSFALEIDGIRVAALDAPLQDWTDHELELLGDVAVLAVRADDTRKLQNILEEVDPRVVIPLKGKDVKMPEVLKACGASGTESVKEWKLKGLSQLPQEGRQIVLLG